MINKSVNVCYNFIRFCSLLKKELINILFIVHKGSEHY